MSVNALLSLAVVAVSLSAACTTDDGPRRLPMGEELGRDVREVFVIDDAIYWMETEAMPEAVGLRLQRWVDGRTVTIDHIDRVALAEQRIPFVVTSDDDLIWGLGSSFIGCGVGRWLRAGQPPAALAMLTEQRICRAVPLAVHGDVVWALAPDQLGNTSTVAPYAIASGDASPGVGLDGWPLDRAFTTGDEALVGMFDPYGWADEGELFHLELPLGRMRRVGALTNDGSFTVTDDQIVVIDNGPDDTAARVLAFPRDLDLPTPAPPPVEIATLPAPAHGMVTAGGALWIAAGSWRTFDEPLLSTVWRVELDGTMTRFELDLPVLELSGTRDALLVVVDDERGLSLRRIPLPAQ